VHLRIVTYNIHRAIGMDRRFRLERIIEILSAHDPDVALLQEVDDGVPRSDHLNLAVELAFALGYPHLAVGHNVRLRRGRYGNATLSRFPIVRERNIDLTIGVRKARGCQHTTLRVERPSGHAREMEVFNLHLGLSATERARQVGILARSKELAPLDPGTPCVVGGDFNDWRNLLGPLFTELLGFRCATARRSGRTGSIRTYPSFSPTGGLDRLYVRGPLRVLAARSCRLRLSRLASDHLPVIVDFHLQ
jgi:endonuclease/exonuclease/phosphatase family metal-dependent hydrolase